MDGHKPQDLQKKLVEFKKNHPKLNSNEQKIINDSILRLDRNKSQEQEKIILINDLRTLSANSNLTNDGKELLTMLQKNQWLWGLINQAPFFR